MPHSIVFDKNYDHPAWYVVQFRRLMRGVKDQIKQNRAEEKQRMMEEKNIADEHRKILKTGMQHVAGAAKVSFVSSPRSTPSPSGDRPGSAASSADGLPNKANQMKSILNRASHMTGSKGSLFSQSSKTSTSSDASSLKLSSRVPQKTVRMSSLAEKSSDKSSKHSIGST